MSKGRGWLTPDNPGDAKRCRVIRFPDSDACESIVAGALLELTYSWNWEKFGSATIEQMTELFLDTVDAFNKSETCMPIGSIVAYTGDDTPLNHLLCDGSQISDTVYPELCAVIGAKFGAIVGDLYTLPDLRSSFVVGSGQGAGLSSYAIGDNGGAEGVSLTAAENGAHDHSTIPHTHGYIPAVPTVIPVGVGVPAPSAIPGVGVTDLAGVTVNSSGSGVAHENRPPYLALSFIIRAK